MEKGEKSKILKALWYPCMLVGTMMLFKLFEMGIIEHPLSGLGVYPRQLKGLTGIITAPFVHGSAKHLFNNSIPMFVLSWSLFYFYRVLAWRIFLLVYFISGLLVWAAARPSWHIGASGVIYGLAAFLFFSGILRKYTSLIAISLMVVFLYGYMVWGILPLEEGVSWESHLYGGVTGFVLAFYYKDKGPQRPVYDWEHEEENEGQEDSIKIVYSTENEQQDKG